MGRGGECYVLALQPAFLSLSGNPGGIPAARLQILARGLSSLDHKYHNIRILLYERSVNSCIIDGVRRTRPCRPEQEELAGDRVRLQPEEVIEVRGVRMASPCVVW
jgi:hypothetical protein